MTHKKRYVDAVCREIEERKGYIGQNVRTIYLGGGTPSLLSGDELRKIFDVIERCFVLDELEEVTIECNPDDVNDDFLRELRKTPVNRISMGVQSLNDKELKWLNRRHSAEQAKRAVDLCRGCGYDNISIDLMFGLPVQTLDSWKETLERAMKLGVEHVSSYSLMYEEGSRLMKMYNQGEFDAMDDESSREMFDILCDVMQDNGYEQYEISNFAKEGRRSKHNSAYWRFVPYLGVGAGAHSFDGSSRQENVSNTLKYIGCVEKGVDGWFVVEDLDDDKRFNEVIFTSLRTKEGVSLKDVENRFGKERLEYVMKVAKRFIEQGLMKVKDGRVALTREGIYVSDAIMSDFMIVREW